MRHSTGLILVAVMAGLVPPAVGQTTDYALRTLLTDPTTSQDMTHQFGMSMVRGNYVCPICGYSALLGSGTWACPNPYHLPDGATDIHPAGTLLVPVASQRDRLLDVARAWTSAATPPSCDIAYRDTTVTGTAADFNTPNRFRAVVGRPLHPSRTASVPPYAQAPGNNVYAEFAWRNRPGGGAPIDWTNARVHFLTIPPGVREPQVWYDSYTKANYGDADDADANTNDDFEDAGRFRELWQGSHAYIVGDRVSRGVSYRGYECIQAHTSSADTTPPAPAPADRPPDGASWPTYWKPIDLCDIKLNPHRVADGDTYYIRYYSHARSSAALSAWRLVVCSRLYGLMFDSDRQTGRAYPDSQEHFRVVTADGGLRLDMATKQDLNAGGPPGPPGNNAYWEMSFKTHSNCNMLPPPERGPVPDHWGDGTLTGGNDLNGQIWRHEGVFYEFANNKDLVTNRDTVDGDATPTTPAVPYAIQPGQVGVGRVEVHWQRGENVWAGTVTMEDTTQTEQNQTGANITVRTFYFGDDNLEWRYDVGRGPFNSFLAPPSAGFASEYEPLESRFVVSPYQVPPTADTDRHGAVERNPGGVADDGYARITAGHPGTGGDRVARAGETTTRREFFIKHLLTQGTIYYRCPACGAVFITAQDRGQSYTDTATYPGWATGTVYVAGTRVTEGATNYLCIRPHRPAALNRPGSGANWSDFWEASPTTYPEDRGYGVCPCHGDHTEHNSGGGKPDAAHSAQVYFAAGERVGLERIDARGARVRDEVVRSLVVPELGLDTTTTPNAPVPWLAAFPGLRPHIPDEAVQLGRAAPYVAPGTAASTGTPSWVSVNVPRYQPASEPGQSPGNTDAINAAGAATPDGRPERNWDYRGMAVSYETAPATVTRFDASKSVASERWWMASQATRFQDNDSWDAYFVCPDCGQPYSLDVTPPPAWNAGTGYAVGDTVSHPTGFYGCIAAASGAGTEPGVAGAWRTYWARDRLLQCRNPQCPGHEWCPACGCIYPAGTGTCPFDGMTLIVVKPEADGSGDENFGFRHLAAEQYDAFDIQLPVLKNTELVAGRTSMDLGRTAPGVDLTNPDRTIAAAGGTPTVAPYHRRPDPADVSHVGRLELRNEGNTIPAVSGVVPLAAGTGLEDRLWRLFRPEADQVERDNEGRSYGWVGMRNPIAASLKRTFRDDTGAALPGTLILPVQTPDAATGSTAGVGVRAGGSGVAGAVNVIGTGQVLGRYSGTQVYFIDQNANGVFDFAVAGVATTSALAVFDPERDRGLEPYMVSTARVRVSESRLPFNDHKARDAAPAARFAYDANGNPTGLRAFWMTDRAGSPTVGASMDLVYADATLDPNSAGENRSYVWNTGADPTVLASSLGALTQIGPVDTYSYPGDMSQAMTLWSASDRGSGGLRNTITWASTDGTSGTLWTGQDRAENVRGFYDPDLPHSGAGAGHWCFWQTGTRGHERIMYRAQLGTANKVYLGALPVDNSISTADPDSAEQTWVDPDEDGPDPARWDTNLDGTVDDRDRSSIRRFPHGPFTAVKDVAPFLYTPPVHYNPALYGTEAQPQVRVFFAGYARHLGNFDIYEVRFNRDDLVSGKNNSGKVSFGYVEGGTPGLPVTNPSVSQPKDPATLAGPGEGPGEQFTGDVLRREFHSRHLDWLTGTGGPSVTLTLGVRVTGLERAIHYYDVTWGTMSAARGEGYDAKRGVYTVIPRFSPHDPEFYPVPPLGDQGPAAPANNSLPKVRYYAGGGLDGADAYEFIDPTTRGLADAEKAPLKLEIDPAVGRVRFSAPLFNVLDPGDRTAVFNTSFNYEDNDGKDDGQVVDVFLCGDYTPFVWRHTTSPADDDCPTIISQHGPWHGNEQASAYPWSLDSNNTQFTLMWRRAFGSGQAPYHGRTCYMMKLYNHAVRVNHPPIVNVGSLEVKTPSDDANPQAELVGPGMPAETAEPIDNENTSHQGAMPKGWDGSTRNEFDVDAPNGEIAIWPGVTRWVRYPNGDWRRAGVGTVRIKYRYQYVDAAGAVQTAEANEVHSVGGWSEETVIPIDTVLAEGPLRVAEETYRVPALQGQATPTVVARRYWVFWTSPRPGYDLRLPAAGVPGSQVYQSSDIFYCAINPEFPTLVGSRERSDQATQRFRPPY